MKLFSRYLLVWIADAVSIGTTALLLPGIYFIKESQFWYLNPFLVAIWLALLNGLVRPMLIILFLPINFVSLGLTTLVLNSALFYLIDRLVPSFVIENFGAALVGLLVLTSVHTILTNIMAIEEDYSLFLKVMDKLSALTKTSAQSRRQRNLIVLQIDGLSFSALKRAINRGKMPFVAEMVARRRHAMHEWFSGLPSQTSSVQAGIFYGNNYNIPGFRWYSKTENKIYESSNSSDMHEIDKRLSSKNGTILEGGTCINTLIHGGAKKKLLTLSVILEKDFRRRRSELEDFAIFSLHPYLYSRAVVLMIWEFFVDRFQRVLEILKNKTPRVKRGIKFSLLRSVGNTFLRESTTFFIMEDIVRGIPIIYVNYIGYDIIAHHAGPLSWDAINSLSGIDRQIRKINRAVIKKAEKPYDIIILSDHGQARCVPFSTLYGRSLPEYIEDLLKKPLLQNSVYDPGRGYLATLLHEMSQADEAFGTQTIRRSRRALERISSRIGEESSKSTGEEDIIICSTGSLAHVYFAEYAGRLTVEDILRIHPELIESVSSHPGIGFVMLRNSDNEVLVFGKKGVKRLRSGNIDGEDPLAEYNNDAVSTEALQKLAEYPDSGDVILVGSVLDRGQIVSFENQVGTHGGIGGEQTEAFIIHPRRSAKISERINSPIAMNNFLKHIIQER